jgi:CheY-like chemotaxis protein
VLVVEDNAETRGVVEMLLEINGYAVALACDGAEALDYLRAGNRACLIVLDLRMPVMDGWTFLRILKDDPALADIPVIAFSANLEGELPGTVATVRKAGVDPELFLGLIERACLPDATPAP